MAVKITKPGVEYDVAAEGTFRRRSGGINFDNPLSSYSLEFDMDPVMDGVNMRSPFISQLMETDQSSEIFFKIEPVGALLELDAGVLIRSTDGVFSIYVIIKFNVTMTQRLLLVAVIDGGPPSVIHTSAALPGAMSDPIGLRVRCTDEAGLVRVQALYNDNGAGWIEEYNGVDALTANGFGIPGECWLNLRADLPDVGGKMIVDDWTISNDVPS